MIAPGVNSAAKGCFKMAGINLYGFNKKCSFPLTDVRSIHWMIGTKH